MKYYTRKEINELSESLNLSDFQFRKLEKEGILIRLPIKEPKYTKESVDKFLNPQA